MKKSSIVAMSLAASLALAACAGDANENDGPTPDGDTPAQPGAALTIAKPDGAVTTESNNPWIGDSSALKLGYINAILEPLAIVNLVDPAADVQPWLAEEIDWSDDYTSVTLTARDGVSWSDGEDFTAEDIAFTFQLISEFPELDTGALGLTGVSSDGNTVTLTFESPMFVKQDNVLHQYIVPQHIWDGVENPSEETFLDPVGTGPYTLTTFTSQSVQLDARDDYWGGDLAVPTLYYLSYNDNTALTTALASGEADWAQAFIPNAESAYIGADPEHNQYWAPAGLGIDTMYVNTTIKPFNDVAFRQAVNLTIDRSQHQAIAREGGVPPLTSVTGLPTPAGDPYINDEYQGLEYAPDVDAAREVLADAGYSWDSDRLIDPDGEEVSFELQVPQGWNDYVTGISLIADEVAKLGVDATVNTPDVDSWWADKSNGDFQAILHWTDTGATPYDIYSNIMDARWLQPIGEGADNNFGRFDSAEATEALNAYANATDDAERAAALETVQSIFVEEVPAMPIGTRPFISQYNTRNYVGWPSDDDPYVNADPTQPTSVLIFTKLEPAS